jgi:hypothetical protein
MIVLRAAALVLSAALLLVPPSTAGEFAPFAGLQYGGSFNAAATGRTVSIGADLVAGATLDFPIGETWGVEFLYSRQATDLSGGADIAVERYMAGVREQKGEGPTRFFGVFLLGATRFVPGFDGFDSDVRFTAGVSLGVKHSLTSHFGLRAETRGWYVVVDAGGGTACVNGACLFVYRSSGLWQGDVTGSLVFTF